MYSLGVPDVYILYLGLSFFLMKFHFTQKENVILGQYVDK